MNINDAIELLKSYNGPFELTLRPGANEVLIAKLEHTYGITFPNDFKALYRFTNGFEIDEDMLAIICLEEMVGNIEQGKPIWIAEYMIYCDMWSLEINPDNPNDYSIYYPGWDSEKIMLTHSLGEFIERVMIGAVFEKGGLWHWNGEIRAKTYGNTNPRQIKPLLGAFRECLKLDLILQQEVTDWADWTISTEDKPDRFIIDVAYCPNLHDLLSILNSINLTEDILQVRAIFGVIHLKFLTGKMTSDKALSILEKFADRKEFTHYEINEIRFLIEERGRLYNQLNRESRKQLNQCVKTFFENYSVFNLHNYKNWIDINAKLISKFSMK